MKVRSPYSGKREIDWATTPDRNAPAREWSPNTIPGEYASCGCFMIPWPVIRYLGADSVFCEAHGWVSLLKGKAKNTRPGMRKIPSEFGYQVTFDGNS
jgi:hypothetical protein